MKNNFVLSFTFKLLPPKTIKSNTLFGQNKDKMTKKIISRSHKAVAAAAVSADLACTDQKKKKKRLWVATETRTSLISKEKYVIELPTPFDYHTESFVSLAIKQIINSAS